MKNRFLKITAGLLIGGGVAASMHHQSQKIRALEKQNTDLAAILTALPDVEAENQRLKSIGMEPEGVAALRKKADKIHALRAEIGRMRERIKNAPEPSATVPKSTAKTLTGAENKQLGVTPRVQILLTSKILDSSNKSGELPVSGAGVLSQEDYQRVLKHARDTAGIDILSAPRIVTVDDREAQVQVGRNTPIETGFFAQANGKKVQSMKTNILTGITADVHPAVQPDGVSTLLKVKLQITTFDGYLDQDLGKPAKKVGDDLWFHETTPIVDIAEGNTAAVMSSGQTMMLKVTSKLTGKKYWAFFTPTFIDPAGNEIAPPGKSYDQPVAKLAPASK
ncbi:MAG: hypothetical protein ACPGVU_03305 [Limisphaerales bacterium]